MKRITLLLFVLMAAGIASAQSRFILRYTESAPLSAFLATYQLQLDAQVAGRPIYRVVDPLGRDPQTLINQIDEDNDEDVAIEVDRVVGLPILSLPAPQTGGLEHLRRAINGSRPVNFFGSVVPIGYMNQRAAWQSRANASWNPHGLGNNQLVAVIDTGVDGTHPFFAGRVVKGIDWLDPKGNGSELQGLPATIFGGVNPTTTPLLERQTYYISNGTAPVLETSALRYVRTNSVPVGLGHGTMVAGAIRLVAPQARILPIRAFAQNGLGTLFDMIRSIHAAEDRGARIVNMSFNLYVDSPELRATCDEVSSRGVILVASTGNDGLLGTPSFPASCDKVTGIASVSSAGLRSVFSNAGSGIAYVAAPGEALYLPYPGNRWAGGWGTSFAAPLVTGLAAKIRSANPSASYSTLQSALSRSAPLADPHLGLGQLDVFNSMAGL